MIDLDLVEEFIVFLRKKGRVEEADQIAETYKIFKEQIGTSKEEIEEKLSKLAQTPEAVTDDLKIETKDGAITLEDCDFITFAVLPNGDMHIVDIDPEDIKDLIAETGHFRVHEKPVGKAEINVSYNGQKPDKKYLN